MFTRSNFQIVTVLLSLCLIFSVCSKAPEDKSEHSDHEVSLANTDQTDITSWNKACPVCGGPVSADLKTVTYEGKVYGFGCAGCPEEFELNPQKYAKNLNEDGTRFIGD